MTAAQRPTFSFAGRTLSHDAPPLIVAELSGNHKGDLQRALTMMEAAAQAGADAVKLQTYTPDTLTIRCERNDFRIRGGLWDGYALYDLYREAHTPFEWHDTLFAWGRDLGVVVFSTAFDETAVDLLEQLANPIYKIASFEAVDLPLIAYAAKTGKPLIISTGMASLGEIGEAVETAGANGAGDIALLHCVSAYPAPVADANLRTIPHLAEAFGVVAGLSDHTPGSAVSVAAVSLGGAIIEKHFTLSRADGGPDAAFSLEPGEFERLVRDCKAAWAALGRVHYDRESSETRNIVLRRSLYVVKNMRQGEVFTRDNVRSIRPGYGLAPKYLDAVLGKRAARSIDRGEPLRWDMLRSPD